MAESRGAVFIAPTSRWFGEAGADFDHPGGNGTYWETANNPNPDTNEDLVLVRALIQEARRAYNVDPARVYAYGHSNGGFMAYFVAQVLRDRVVGFGENAAGLSLTTPHQACRFQGRGATCAALATQPGWCPGGALQLPIAVPTTGRHTPAVLFHGTSDPVVSVFHTCTLERLCARAGRRGADHPLRRRRARGLRHLRAARLRRALRLPPRALKPAAGLSRRWWRRGRRR